MRTLIVIVLVAIAVAVGVAFAFGILTVATEKADGTYAVTFTVHTNMLSPAVKHEFEELHHGDEIKGKITAIEPDTNQIVVANGPESWTIEVPGSAKVSRGGHDVTRADLGVGDQVDIAYERQGDKLIAKTIKANEDK